MPSSCGILVYSNLTSRVTRRVLGGRGGRFCNFTRESVVSLMYYGNFSTSATRDSTANDINDANKKRVILLTVFGPMTYELLRSLKAPEKLKDKSYTDLVEAMRKHDNPKLSEMVQRH